MPDNMSSKAIPVYLFLGFFEGGKTKFIQETISNKRFGLDENILLLICEEGIEEYDISQFGGISNLFVQLCNLSVCNTTPFFMKRHL